MDNSNLLRGIIKDKNKTIASQQAEIERLRAALENIVTHDVYPDLNINEAEIYRIAKDALMPAELCQQQPEPSQESLKVRILRYLAECDEVRSYNQISCEISPDKGFLELYLELSKDGLTERYANGSAITQAGRDYLASLDKEVVSDDEFRKGFDEFVKSLGGNPDNTSETFLVTAGDKSYSVAVGGVIHPRSMQGELDAE